MTFINSDDPASCAGARTRNGTARSKGTCKIAEITVHVGHGATARTRRGSSDVPIIVTCVWRQDVG
ncbi:MAG: hypothetical protein WC184_07585 [Acidimicrobiia bacterium]